MVRGNKTDWENEAADSGIDLIRKNNAPIGGVFGHGDSGPQGGAFDRGGFRGFGGVGRSTTLPNGQPINYMEVNIPSLNGLLGFGQKDSGEKPNFATFVGPPAPVDPKKHPIEYFFGKNRPETYTFKDTKIGSKMDEVGDFIKWGMSGFNPLYGGSLIGKNVYQMLDEHSPDYSYEFAAKFKSKYPDAYAKIQSDAADKWVGIATMLSGNVPIR